jgi:hypothetical protein
MAIRPLANMIRRSRDPLMQQVAEALEELDRRQAYTKAEVDELLAGKVDAVDMGGVNWVYSSAQLYSQMWGWLVEYDLNDIGAAVTIESPIAAVSGCPLRIVIKQHATTPLTINFGTTFKDPFVNIAPDANTSSTFHFTGRDDELWWPIGIDRTGISA